MVKHGVLTCGIRGALASALLLAIQISTAQTLPREMSPSGAGLADGQDAAEARQAPESIQRAHIRSQTVWRVPVSADGTEGKPVQISSTTFDEQGDPLGQTLLGQEVGQPGAVINRYDGHGRIVETFNKQPGPTGNARMTYYYDSKGHLQVLRSFRADGTPLLSFAYTYDATGHLADMALYAGDGRFMFRGVFGYRPDGKITAMKVLRPEGRKGSGPKGPEDGSGLIASTLYGYDRQGRPTEQTRLDGSGKTLARTVWSYGGPGGQSQMEVLNAKGQVTTEITYTHDAQGKVIEQTTSFPGANLRTTETWSYDQYGNPLERTRYNKLGQRVEVVRYVYQYYTH